MAELISALADAKIEAAESTERIAELQHLINSKQTLNFEDGVYFRNDDNDGKVGLFCATCYDSTSKEIRLQHVPGAIFGDWNCRVCNGSFR
jgi:hypothetical protein